MDWHKLQHKLFEMDPVDPRAELERLRKVAQTPTPLEEPDLIKKSFDIKPGSMPLGIDSISDFAALAGIRLDEKQLKGPAGQAKGSDPMPAAKAGRTKHPLKDKLVGEAGALDSLKHGFSNYNQLNALNPNSNTINIGTTRQSPDNKNPTPDIADNVEYLARLLSIRDIQKFSTAVVSASQGNPISSSDKQTLGEAFQHLLLLQETKKREVFKAMLGLTPRQATKATATNAVPPPQPTANPNTSTPTQQNSSKSFDTSKQTIKEHLLKLLEEKKLK